MNHMMLYGYMAINEPLTFESGVIDVFIGTGTFTGKTYVLPATPREHSMGS